ncbi:Stk1 family PASTA domain-containing Ser/Thr kinase [Streptomyces sp. 3MP-14]|uniref:non-specific serine/threonine protein kinase n=1 Tax=Streptomyces mimosae TaxID=2586635 RepID=A0A5N6AII7_9ACTN|nr:MULTISPECIES: Stk1 family PASTA domain-containing Ser/Thr kinase [Streptomyces]KAB8168647.1 Stk1 family PASTA domain-containing Ser/Thr kinase [Streptomyces mimosae]KAB8178073.1 Stk1 family PASTA domain-containing Ser/Thr kinase [Streptomyces sp. 3MP-14]
MDTTLHDPLIGRVLDGRYQVVERIAVGGMATVYRAVDTRLDRVLALKVMHPPLVSDAGFVARFIREAKAVARLDHPNIVGVLDQGADGGYVYLAMEYVDGCTLRDVLRERGALAVRPVLDILEPMLAGLAAAHRAGLVHRDVKPENVLIGSDGRVKVADFGLVRGVDGPTSADTGSLLGTVSYLAPEQIESGAVDARTDVYACGVLLYEMLTGGKPHTGDSPAQVLYAHVHHDVPPPSEVVPGLAPPLDQLVAAATARAPEGRLADAAAMLASARRARAALSDAQLDAPPPVVERPEGPEGAGGAGPLGPEDETRRVARLPGAVRPEPAGVDHTARIELPSGAPLPPEAPPRGRRRLSRRGVLSLVLAGVLLLAGGIGVWYINSGQFQRTPGVYDLPVDEAEQELRSAGLKVRIVEDYSETVEPGHVISTDPERGERVRRNATVTLVVSRGPEIAEVPNLRGVPVEEAREQLAEAGLAVGEETERFSDEVPRGAVIESDPEPGAERRPETAVNLVVSRGQELSVPNVVGEPEGSAMQRLREAGFDVEVAEERVHSEEEAGTVAEQSPVGGESAGEGDTVELTISQGPEMIMVPDVRGEDEDEARRILEDLGFRVDVNQLFFTGTVFNQSVRGEEAPRGSTITLWVR